MNDKLLTNYTEDSFLNHINDCLTRCESFCFSVSFVKKAGLVLLEKNIEECLKKGKKGRFICSTYQNFTDISSLNTLLNWMNKYPNFECHLDLRCFGENGFHTKGYIFNYGDSKEVVIGSSNITRFALIKNIEWNVSIFNKEEFESYKNALSEYDGLWNNTLRLSNELINRYKLMLEYAIEKWDMDYFNFDEKSVKPNKMQKDALKELRRYRDLGVTKALVVAATGSGKTYLAAFDAANFDAKRILYICHRDVILSEAMKSFKVVFGSKKTYGFYNGKLDEREADVVFASTNMVVRHIGDFYKKEFDYIVYDEAHHIMSDGGQKIFEYFSPSFLLGLTATPERMDDKSVFDLFEHNVPFELRLKEAISADLIVPFHYYGIRDDKLDYGDRQSKSEIARQISDSINVDYIIEEIEKHKKNDEKLKAVAFCVDRAHCKLMAEQFNEKGYGSVSLSGENDTGERILSFNKLQDEDDKLEIICTVDILNEGVDIPGINMVLFLRPTESSVIFTQQLGRGLRKYKNKEFVTVLDFIGNNYLRSAQIALSLGALGDTPYMEKQYLMDMVREDFKYVTTPGVTIEFDELSKQEILDSLERMKFTSKDIMKQDYLNFKKYLQATSYPKHVDYFNSELAPDLIKFIKSSIGNKKNVTYYQFLKQIGEENLPSFNEEQIKIIEKLSEFLPLVRLDEFLVVKQLLTDGTIDASKIYGNMVTNETLENALHYLNKEGVLNNNKIDESILSNDFVEYVNDLLEYGILRYEQEFGKYEGRFKLYGNYYKEQIMKVLLEKNKMFVKGTKFYDDGRTILFVGLKKDQKAGLRYKDKFIDHKNFQWESEINTTEFNQTGKNIINSKDVTLFIRKIESEDGITLPFTYMGNGKFHDIRESKTDGNPTLIMNVELNEEIDSKYDEDFAIPNVAAAIILNDDKVFVAQRGYGEHKGKWEFPGGKIKEHETAEDALIREIKEELDIQISVDHFYDVIDYRYPDFHLRMSCFICSLNGEMPKLKEHDDSKWISINELKDIDWLPADKTIISNLISDLTKH